LLGLVEEDARSEPASDVGEKAVEAITDQIRRLDPTTANAAELVGQGRRIFRFDTFGDETFWGDMLQLHLAIEGARFGGVGPGLSPKDVLSLGLKVDVDALPRPLLNRLARGQVNLDDPAVTLQLLKLDAVVGLTGFFNSSGTTLNSVVRDLSFDRRQFASCALSRYASAFAESRNRLRRPPSRRLAQS
jgi:hypothetical protein